MYQFSNIKSHPDLPLESHLSQVADIAINLLENKKMDFSKLGISKTHVKRCASAPNRSRAAGHDCAGAL